MALIDQHAKLGSHSGAFTTSYQEQQNGQNSTAGGTDREHR